MRYIKFCGGTPYCGTDFTDLVTFEDGTPDADIDEYAEELARDNGESFEYLDTGWDGDFESEEDREAYYEECWCYWTEISEEEYWNIKEEEGL